MEFKRYDKEVKRALNQAAIAGLHAAAGEIVSSAKRNTPVDTGQLKNSWSYYVDEDKLEAVIGSPLENAIWNEFGTGEYALHGDGRKGGWFYVDDEGKGHHTFGKKPHRTLQMAFNSAKNVSIRAFENSIKQLSSGSGNQKKVNIFDSIMQSAKDGKNVYEKMKAALTTPPQMPKIKMPKAPQIKAPQAPKIKTPKSVKTGKKISKKINKSMSK